MDARNNQNCTLFKLEKGTQNILDTNNGVLYCNYHEDLDDCVLMTPTMFSKIWNRKWSGMNQQEKILPIVKISYKGQSIYRRYRHISTLGFNDYHLGLTKKSIGLLCSNESIIKKDGIQVSVGKEDDYFENHPDHSTRMAYRLGVEANRISKASKTISYVSLIIAILSIVATIIL